MRYLCGSRTALSTRRIACLQLLLQRDIRLVQLEETVSRDPFVPPSGGCKDTLAVGFGGKMI
jgi:hypothetical protein